MWYLSVSVTGGQQRKYCSSQGQMFSKSCGQQLSIGLWNLSKLTCSIFPDLGGLSLPSFLLLNDFGCLYQNSFECPVGISTNRVTNPKFMTNQAGLQFVKSLLMPIRNKLACRFVLLLWHGSGLGRHLNAPKFHSRHPAVVTQWKSGLRRHLKASPVHFHIRRTPELVHKIACVWKFVVRETPYTTNLHQGSGSCPSLVARYKLLLYLQLSSACQVDNLMGMQKVPSFPSWKVSQKIQIKTN